MAKEKDCMRIYKWSNVQPEELQATARDCSRKYLRHLNTIRSIGILFAVAGVILLVVNLRESYLNTHDAIRLWNRAYEAAGNTNAALSQWFTIAMTWAGLTISCCTCFIIAFVMFATYRASKAAYEYLDIVLYTNSLSPESILQEEVRSEDSGSNETTAEEFYDEYDLE